MDWFDQNYVEWYLCNHTKVHYREFDLFDSIGGEVWEEYVYYDFDCSLIRFANDKIRSLYKLSFKLGEAKGRFVNTNKLG